MSEVFKKDEKIRLMLCQQEDTFLHHHDFLELVYVTKGKAVHTFHNKDTIVKKGDFFIIDYNSYHKYTTMKQMKFEIINTLFQPEMIDKSLLKCHSFQDLINHYLIRFSYKTLEHNPTKVIYHDEDGAVYAIIEKLWQEYNKKGAGYIEMMRCYLIEIIIIMMRKINKKEINILDNDFSKYILNDIDENYMKPLTLTDYCKTLNYSLPYLCKRFKKEVGINFNEYLQKKRIEQSCRLISNTDKKFSEIAELVGYSDIKFFNRIFKKHLKMTPREFKKITPLGYF